ncbi:MAG: hypothetical protein JOY90_22970 [Bradyrhizobium sp.]|uniref:hypothetical protein n=1 Tax=Bradyrhizobium sp. TaxID=376 RepID=UPI001DB32E44|nr:hypothetical protein [Bradyrhizobium sp.]MBV9563279.1 hypothetical protein [Bradyrhizobium sp.]
MSGSVDDTNYVTERSPAAIAARGAAIYDRLYRADFEAKWLGRFAAVDIESGQAIVETFPETALAKARSASPHGIFYLVRIGSPGAFKLSRRVTGAHSGRV